MTRDEARAQVVLDMTRALERWGKARDLLSWEQRLFISERMRDAADIIDRGVVVRPQPQPTRPPPRLRRLVQSARRDHDGSPLFRIVTG